METNEDTVESQLCEHLLFEHQRYNMSMCKPG